MGFCWSLIFISCALLTFPSFATAKGNKVLSKTALSLGAQQFQKMLVDRPQMAKWKMRSKALDHWAIEQFAGKNVQGSIRWDNGELTNNSPEYTAESSYNDGKPFIRIRGKVKTDSPESLWSAFIFECFNIKNSPKHETVTKAAIEGLLSRAQFIEGQTRVEFDTMHQSAMFYKSFLLPTAQSKKIKLHPSLWHADQNDTYVAWIRKYNNPNYYPFNSYGAYYDKYIESIYLESQAKLNH